MSLFFKFFPNYKLSDIAEALGLTTRRIQQLVKSNILPKPIDSNYDLAGCIRGYEKYLQQQNPSKNNNRLLSKLMIWN
ncbi:MAG: hypothetical protein ACEY3D_06140 [Rickettsia sp.]|uniref:hypothetical protein n=1 Tax=Rickettsia sp. TaxID=789 RepID=UPI003978572D